MKKLLITLTMAAAIVAPMTASAKPGNPPPSPSPTPPPSTACVHHLTSGGKLTSTGSATTAAIAPTGRVYVFIGMAPSNGETAPVPTLTGGGVTWTWLGTWYKKAGAPRDFTAFTADGASAGALTVAGLPIPKTHVTWSIDQGGEIVSLTVNSEGGLETSHQVTLDHDPVGQVIAGFVVGQQDTVSPVAPYTELGQGHTSFITAMSEQGTTTTAGVTWAQGGHSIGVAIETDCPV